MARDKRPVHTVPHADGWANRREGSERVSRRYGTKAEAEAEGRNTARRNEVEHVVHNKTGEIAKRNSYGNDPIRRKG